MKKEPQQKFKMKTYVYEIKIKKYAEGANSNYNVAILYYQTEGATIMK